MKLIKKILKILIKKEKENILVSKEFQYKGDTYLICWKREKYLMIYLYRKINNKYKEIYKIYDSNIKDKIGSCEDYYIKATKFVMNLYDYEAKQENFKKLQKETFEEWNGVIK